MITLEFGAYQLFFEDGGVEIRKNGQVLYFNHRPVYIAIKDAGALSKFDDRPYERIVQDGDAVTAYGSFVSANGSVFCAEDRYEVLGKDLKITRRVEVVKKAENDLGFYSKIGFWAKESDQVEDFDYFSPGEWYRHNEFASDYAQGKNMNASYFWRKETYCGLPMFAMQSRRTGETICFSRWAADVQLASVDRLSSENYVDPKSNIGSLGISRPSPEALLYTYYHAAIRIPLDVQVDGLSIDYVYPGGNGELPAVTRGPVHGEKPMSLMRVNHPVEPGFVQEYSVAVNLGQYDTFQTMMKTTWRQVYPRLKDRLADISNQELFHNNMRLLKQVTRDFGNGAWGTPFAAQLPQFDPNSTSAEIGFVGQQTGIGYQLVRWGTLEQDAEAVEKGKNILNFWVTKTMTQTGCPKVWYHLAADQFEPQPQWIRQIGDGLEAVIDAYVFLHNRGEEHPDWLDYCTRTADWLASVQNEDGSYYRSYNYDGSMCMDSRANTPSVVRFLVQMFIVTGKDAYRLAAIKAGEWSYVNLYEKMEYRGGTCDNLDVLDKEAGLYGLFAFLALYDLTGEQRWVEAAKGAADYVETLTYIWNFPIVTHFPIMPFNHNHISGQSFVTVGNGGADMYMACGGYAFYRLYLITGDDHYRDYAEFIHINSKQANDVDGSVGYAIPGLVHESGGFAEQIYQGHYHWLPWCTFVEVDPVSRMLDTFGVYEIAQAQKLPAEELQRRNRIYDYWYLP